MRRTGPATALITTTLEAAYRYFGLERRSVLIAVSGGADSVALLEGTARVCGRLGLSVEVATLDHGLRPEAVEEVRAVERLAALHGFPCHVRQLRLKAGAGVEQRAREARYAALEAVRLERGLAAMATAHTASDQAETLLMRLARGTSLRGAAGVLSRRGTLVRPLLERTRGEIEAFLREQSVGFVVDPMNEDPRLFRSRVRHDVLPALSRAAGFPVARQLASFARLAAEDDALLSELADTAWRRLVRPEGSLDAVGVRALEPPLRRRVLSRLLAQVGAVVDDATLARVLEAVARGRSATLSAGLQLRAAGGSVRCVRPQGASRGTLTLEGAGAAGLLKGTGWRFQVSAQAAPPGALVLTLPEDTRWPLTVRTRRAGDRVSGAQGSRKLQDVFVDLRVPAERRDLQPVVTDSEGRLLWVPGIWGPPGRKLVGGQSLWALPPIPSDGGSAPL
ncbi:tRNA lysidine(34) synthetase TilS [Hyalangium rubrum]|uniref:tRNA(Ile)-lysidine synthase n=1 Tax=Hyalangium rubrum TaxID=3103134 RepID=A0ABU5H616_9BACT|nr:tRNA lysidine(34) synthetase TilS [Hyalangium sp. s54d21]MDY7228314.1 tRNA lysidine(34) synthetase TilS [Hyalangium sp. s54d21]